MNLPVVLEVNGVVNMKSIDMYIGHDRSVGVCLAKRSRIESNRPLLFTKLRFARLSARWQVGIGHNLVLAA